MSKGSEVEGLDRLTRLLKDLGEDADRTTGREVMRSLLNIQTGAKRRIQVRSGRLRNSIAVKTDKDGKDGQVGTNVAYAAHVHFGTGRRGQASAGDRFKGSYDTSFEGMPANPFLYDAAEEERPQFLQRLEERLRDVLTKRNER